MTITPDDILKQFNRLNNTPSGEQHAKQYSILKDMVRHNQGALYDLVFSGKVESDKDLSRLILFGGDGGSTAKDVNDAWIPFVKRVWDRRYELSDYIRLGVLDWYAAQWGISE